MQNNINFLKFVFISLVASAAIMPVHAAEHENKSIERYSIAKTDDGFVRTDSQTGHTSLCTLRETQLICRASADERQAFEESITRLEARIAALEQAPAITPSPKMPTEEQMDEAFSTMEGFVQRFFSMIEEIKPEASKPE